jgi:hypothetical protein
MTSEGARSEAVAYWKDGSDALRTASRFLARCAAVARLSALPKMDTTEPAQSLLQREGRLGSAVRTWSPALRDGCDALDFEQDWADHRPISRSSVKPRKTGEWHDE